MENSKILAEAIVQHCFETYASCYDNSLKYTCRYCSSGATEEPQRYEHDSECPVALAQQILEA